MNTRHCLRCGSTNLQAGIIYDYWQYGKTNLTFHWKPETPFGVDSLPLHAVLCKSCGHVELIANLDAFIPTTRRECPHCKAIYSYRQEYEISPNIVKCQNCHKTFKIYPPKKCPSCGAVYLYSTKKIKEGTTICQNCGKLFLIQDSNKSDELIDDIEEGLQKE